MRDNMKFLLSAMILCSLHLLSAANLPGPFKAEALAFYFVHNGGPLKLEAALAPVKDSGAVLTRIFDAEEQLVSFDYRKFSSPFTLNHDFGTNAPKGIYQIRTSGMNYTVDPKAVPETLFGIMPSRCMMNSTALNQFQKFFFLIPEGTKQFDWVSYGSDLKLQDASGNPIPGKKAEVSDRSGEVWQGSILLRPDNPYYRLGFNGMPVILCGDAATAKAIDGSVEKASDGTLYAHKFQVRMHDWLKSLKKSDLDVKIVDLRTLKKEFEAEPKASGLLGPWGIFSHINYQLQNQNTTPGSKDFGKVINPVALAVVNSLNAPFNPYCGKLDNRLLASVFPALLRMKESETNEDSCNNYSGGDALVYVSSAQALGEGTGSIKDKALRDLWIDGARRTADRFSMFRVSCENQSSHWPFCYTHLYHATGDKTYRRLSDDFILGMSTPERNPFMKTGYQEEAYGPDATYQGLGACFQAAYYRMSDDPVALEGLRAIHDFMNHSVVREPDGRMVGASNFSHRTAGSWINAQYGAGRTLLKGILPEAAVLHAGSPDKVDFDHSLAPSSSLNPNAIEYATAVFGPFLSDYRFPNSKIKDAKLPFEKSESFTKNVNNEFIAVRRPAYYAFVYIGSTAPEWTKNLRCKTAANPKLPTYKWTQTQGLSVLWFKGYGALILGMNWDGNSGQFLRGDLPDGKIAFPDYWDFSAGFQGNILSAKGTLFQAEKVKWERITEFLDPGIRQKITVDIPSGVSFTDLYEQIPFLKNKPSFQMEFLVDGKYTSAPGIASAVRFGKNVVLKLDSPRLCSLGPSRTLYGQEIASLRIHFGKPLKPDAKLHMEYTITGDAE